VLQNIDPTKCTEIVIPKKCTHENGGIPLQEWADFPLQNETKERFSATKCIAKSRYWWGNIVGRAAKFRQSAKSTIKSIYLIMRV